MLLKFATFLFLALCVSSLAAKGLQVLPPSSFLCEGAPYGDTCITGSFEYLEFEPLVNEQFDPGRIVVGSVHGANTLQLVEGDTIDLPIAMDADGSVTGTVENAIVCMEGEFITVVRHGEVDDEGILRISELEVHSDDVIEAYLGERYCPDVFSEPRNDTGCHSFPLQQPHLVAFLTFLFLVSRRPTHGHTMSKVSTMLEKAL